ncbi:Na+/H+ antiporter subunit E [Frankia sp. CNm7]|uniref:Na+/H+ antiporter subunit E n=1 Tax=Frankia nepalensis TaxID=1836974 RepID=A0A937UQV2_9ACTN|nr:Na+/H+ antiporter subunit E [Frankia nepalensis]MBL7516131.1 Na+/H+ antiporter subunit E [Frankia nepalensis]MBL7524946.1 Na+/H+ antiporter subunit E [Frankia nepalensis]MBL7627106.1 Na+/H+ antiporter subunit E [Frankia nepalensis]
MTRRPAQLAWLWLVWVLLWGRVNGLVALSGVAVAATVLAAFPLRPLGAASRAPRIRPPWALALGAYLIADLVPSSLKVATQMIRFGPATPSAIIAVPLRTRSEVVSTLVAHAVSLAPGSSVLEVDRDAGVFYVHMLTSGGPEAVESARARIDGLQRRVIRAFPDQPDRPAQPDRPSRSDHPDRPVTSGHPEEPDHHERPAGPFEPEGKGR